MELEHDLALELDAETPSGFPCVQQLVLRRAGVERRPKGRAVAARVEKAGERENLGPGLLLQLPPERQRFLRELHPLRLVVREAEDARRAVARPVRVADLELLEHGDVAAGAPERPGRGEAHHARPDDDDVALGQWWWGTTAWPLPRAISQRLTG